MMRVVAMLAVIGMAGAVPQGFERFTQVRAWSGKIRVEATRSTALEGGSEKEQFVAEGPVRMSNDSGMPMSITWPLPKDPSDAARAFHSWNAKVAIDTTQVYKDVVGNGNISCRFNGDRSVVATLSVAPPQQYALAVHFEDPFELRCTGTRDGAPVNETRTAHFVAGVFTPDLGMHQLPAAGLSLSGKKTLQVEEYAVTVTWSLSPI